MSRLMPHTYSGIVANRGIKSLAEVTDYASADAFLGDAEERQIGANVRIVRLYDRSVTYLMDGVEVTDCIGVKLYDTVILRYYRNGFWTAHNGGFNTPTTRARATQFGPRGVYFYHHKGELLPKEGWQW